VIYFQCHNLWVLVSKEFKSDQQKTYEGFVKEFLRRKSLPRQNFTVRVGEDSAGDPAVWIEFLVDNDLSPSKAKLGELTKLVDSVSQELISKDPQRWPYVRLKTAA
jgi:hypothetical protein